MKNNVKPEKKHTIHAFEYDMPTLGSDEYTP